MMRLKIMLGVFLTVLAVPSAALAYFTASGTGSVTATVGTLAAPTAVSGGQTAGTGTVTVTWSAPSTGTAPQGYYVQRTGGSTVGACGTSSTSLTTATSCSDTSVPLGSYTYTVTAVFRSWSTRSAPSATVTVASSAQTVTFTSTPPANATVGGATYTPTATATSGLPVTITVDGTATSVCSISGGAVSFTHSGTCLLDGNQAGNTYWTAAPQTQQSITVSSASATHFSVAVGSSQTAGTAFSVTVTALDASNNPVTVYTGSHTITLSSANALNSPSGATPVLPSGTVSFSNGVGVVSGVTLVDVQTGVTLTATDGTVSGTSGAIGVGAGAAAHLAWAISPSSPACYFTCANTGVKNHTAFKAKIRLTDAEGNPVNAASQLSITVSNTGGSFTNSSTVTIPAGASTSSSGGDGAVGGEITFTTDNGQFSDSLRMTSTPTSYPGATASFSS